MPRLTPPSPSVMRSERLTLRPFRRSDLAPLTRLLQSMGDGTLFDSGGRPLPPARLAAKMIREGAAHRSEKGPLRLSLAILPKGSRRLIGGAQLACDVTGGAEAGLWFSPPYRSLGLGREALMLLLRFAHENLAVTRLRGLCAADNRASIRLMESCGMRFRHRLTAEDRHGRPIRLVEYAIEFNDQ